MNPEISGPQPTLMEKLKTATAVPHAQLEATRYCAALMGGRPESKVFLVTSINPEAGRHAVPTDKREIRASNEADDLCWARFPYFEFRYDPAKRNP